jgi:hypothetical protein
MLRIVSAFTWLLGCALLFPLHADDSELQLLNVNVGGGLSVPLNPTIRYVGVDGNAGSGMGVPDGSSSLSRAITTHGVISFRSPSFQ